MAKKKKKDRKGSDAADAVTAVRSAVERTLQATAEGAGRIRETIEDLKLVEEIRGLRTEIEALARRVTALENRSSAPSRPAPAKTTPAKRSPVKRAAKRSATAKRSSSKPAARSRAKAKSKPRAKRAA